MKDRHHAARRSHESLAATAMASSATARADRQMGFLGLTELGGFGGFGGFVKTSAITVIMAFFVGAKFKD